MIDFTLDNFAVETRIKFIKNENFKNIGLYIDFGRNDVNVVMFDF